VTETKCASNENQCKKRFYAKGAIPSAVTRVIGRHRSMAAFCRAAHQEITSELTYLCMDFAQQFPGAGRKFSGIRISVK
jgi:anti-sigma factor ChrR (cupin superfamily)